MKENKAKKPTYIAPESKPIALRLDASMTDTATDNSGTNNQYGLKLSDGNINQGWSDEQNDEGSQMEKDGTLEYDETWGTDWELEW